MSTLVNCVLSCQNRERSESVDAPGPARQNTSARGADISITKGEQREAFPPDWHVCGRVTVEKHQKDYLASAPCESLFCTSEASTQVCEARRPLACHALWI